MAHNVEKNKDTGGVTKTTSKKFGFKVAGLSVAPQNGGDYAVKKTDGKNPDSAEGRKEE